MGNIIHVAIGSTLLGIGIGNCKNFIPNKYIRWFIAFVSMAIFSSIGGNFIC